jgi:hypothetical protein
LGAPVVEFSPSTTCVATARQGAVIAHAPPLQITVAAAASPAPQTLRQLSPHAHVCCMCIQRDLVLAAWLWGIWRTSNSISSSLRPTLAPAAAAQPLAGACDAQSTARNSAVGCTSASPLATRTSKVPCSVRALAFASDSPSPAVTRAAAGPAEKFKNSWRVGERCAAAVRCASVSVSRCLGRHRERRFHLPLRDTFKPCAEERPVSCATVSACSCAAATRNNAQATAEPCPLAHFAPRGLLPRLLLAAAAARIGRRPP